MNMDWLRLETGIIMETVCSFLYNLKQHLTTFPFVQFQFGEGDFCVPINSKDQFISELGPIQH